MNLMVFQGDECVLMLTDSEGHRRCLVVSLSSSGRPMWHCRMKEMDCGKVEYGKTPYASAGGANYKLYDTTGKHAGTILNFSLDKVDTDVMYHVGATSGTVLMFRVSYVGKNGKGVYPSDHRTLILPEGGNLQSVGGRICGIGDPGFVKSTTREIYQPLNRP